jgi:hypothetical protein
MSSFEAWIHFVDWEQVRADKALLLRFDEGTLPAGDVANISERLAEFIGQVQDFAAMDLGVATVFGDELSPEDFCPP